MLFYFATTTCATVKNYVTTFTSPSMITGFFSFAVISRQSLHKICLLTSIIMQDSSCSMLFIQHIALTVIYVYWIRIFFISYFFSCTPHKYFLVFDDLNWELVPWNKVDNDKLVFDQVLEQIILTQTLVAKRKTYMNILHAAVPNDKYTVYRVIFAARYFRQYSLANGFISS